MRRVWLLICLLFSGAEGAIAHHMVDWWIGFLPSFSPTHVFIEVSRNKLTNKKKMDEGGYLVSHSVSMCVSISFDIMTRYPCLVSIQSWTLPICGIDLVKRKLVRAFCLRLRPSLSIHRVSLLFSTVRGVYYFDSLLLRRRRRRVLLQDAHTRGSWLLGGG